MKKSLLIITVLVFVVAALPMIGNNAVKSVIDERMTEMDNNGIGIDKKEVDNGYITSTIHYELMLDDADKLLTYINSHHQQQIPTYVKGILDGTRMGVDITYSNLPIFSDIKVGIYPTALSSEMENLFKEKDPVLYASIEKLLINKTLYYQIKYDVSTDTFHGAIRDINNAPVTFKDGTAAIITLERARFNGAGSLIAPDTVSGEIDKLSATFSDQTGHELISIDFDQITLDNTFKSLVDYRSSMKCEHMHIKFSSENEKGDITLENLAVAGGSHAEGDKISGSSTGSIDSFIVNAPDLALKLDTIKADITVDGLDKAAFEAMQTALNRANSDTSPEAAQAVLATMTDLVSKGLFFNLKEFSVAQIALNTDPAMKGFDHRATINVKPDSAFRQKSRKHPMALLENIDVDASLSFSKALYTYITKELPQSALASGFAKEDGDNIRFDIIYKNDQLLVNGKALH